jgi:hypothetical protein
MRKPPVNSPGLMVPLTPQLLKIIDGFPRDIAVLNAVAEHKHYTPEQKKEIIIKTLQGTIDRLT